MADRAREAALRITSMIAAATALAAIAASPCAAAGPEAFVDAGAKVAGHPELTYLDLVKQGVPDLAPSAITSLPAAFSSRAFASAAMVAEGWTRARAADWANMG